MSSAAYMVIRAAMFEEQQVICTYDGYPRELCPLILGHSDQEEKVLAYQVGGSSSRGLPPGGQWKCLFVARMMNVQARKGPWREGNRHSREQTCIQNVDLDINIHVRLRR